MRAHPVTRSLVVSAWAVALACGCAGNGRRADAEVTSRPADVADVVDAGDAGDVMDAREGDGGPDARDRPDVLLRGDADWLLTRVDPDAAPSTDRGCTPLPGADPMIAPARPIGPMNGSRVTSLRPTLQWELPPGVRSVRVELCRDACCTQPIRTLDAEGDRVRPAEALPVGARVWWRVRGREGQRVGARTGATWLFHVPYQDAPTDTFGGRIRDFNGDGCVDLVATGRVSQRNVLFLLAGTRGGLRSDSIRVQPIETFMGMDVQSADFNGDGIRDVFGIDPDQRTISIYHGGTARWQAAIMMVLDRRVGDQCNTVSGFTAADLNGDGFSDLVVNIGSYWGANCEGRFGTEGSSILVFPGGIEGVSRTPAQRVDEPSSVGNEVLPLANVGDVNGDGREDLLGPARRGGIPGAAILVDVNYRSRPGAVRFIAPDDPLDLVAGLGDMGATVGDLDGDRIEDFVVNTIGGRVYLFQSRHGVGPRAVLIDPLVNYLWPRGQCCYFGSGLEFSGDLNGDGHFDLFIADPSSTDTARESRRINMGRGYFFPGGPEGPTLRPAQILPYSPSIPENPRWSDEEWGWVYSLSHLGDIDGDGFDDTAIVDRRAESPRICVVPGSAGLLRTRLDQCVSSPVLPYINLGNFL